MRVPVSLLSIIGLSSGQTCTDLPTKSPSAFDTEFYEYACTINARVENDKITDNTTVCATVKTRWEKYEHERLECQKWCINTQGGPW